MIDRINPAARPQKVLIVDDHPLFRFGLTQLLTASGKFCVCAEADHARAALQAVRDHSPDLAVVDICLPGMNGIELVKTIVAEFPHINVAVVSMYNDTVYALRALRAGAKAYLMKQQAMDNVLTALQKIAEGGVYVTPEFSERLVFKAIHSSDCDFGTPLDRLSDRELEVLQLLGRKKGTREIASDLHVSIKTIETHRMHLKSKLGLRENEELLRFAFEWSSLENGEGIQTEN